MVYWITGRKNSGKTTLAYRLKTQILNSVVLDGVGVCVANNILVHNCFPKDVQAFIGWARSEGLKLDMCEAADKVNTRIRTVKDWLDIKGATSKNNYK